MGKANTVQKLSVKSLNNPDEATMFPNGAAAAVSIEGAMITRATMEPGWKWSEDEKDLAGTDFCPKSHHIYVVSGTLGLQMSDGTTERVNAGDAVAIPPQHDGWTIGDDQLVYIDFAIEGESQ